MSSEVHDEKGLVGNQLRHLPIHAESHTVRRTNCECGRGMILAIGAISLEPFTLRFFRSSSVAGRLLSIPAWWEYDAALFAFLGKLWRNSCSCDASLF